MKKSITITIAIICFILTYMMTIQIRTISQSESEILTLKKENELRDEVNEWKDKYEITSEKIKSLEEKINAYKTATASESLELMQEELEIANILAGLTDIKGEGVNIRVDDTKVIEQIAMDAGYYDPSVYVIQASQILDIINELRIAGAEAISINGQRITANTEIYNSGQILIVNSTRTTSPYEILATGDKDILADYIKRKGKIVSSMEEYGIEITIEKLESIEIPKMENVVIYKHSSNK